MRLALITVLILVAAITRAAFLALPTGVQFATNPVCSLHYAIANPPGPILDPNVIPVSGDPDCLCPSGACWGTNESCTPPDAVTNFTLSCTVDQSEPSQLEVWYSPVIVPFMTNVTVTITNQYYGTNQVLTGINQVCAWQLLAISDGNSYSVPNIGDSGFFMVRSTCLGFISDWGNAR